MKTLTGIAAFTVAAFLYSCGQASQESTITASGLNTSDFDTVYTGVQYEGKTYSPGNLDAKSIALYQLKNENGMEVCITNFGGRIVSIVVPDKDGNMKDVVLGFSKAEDYFPWNNTSDFGSAIGRYANRLNQGIVNFDGEDIQLPKNNFGHCLHGGFTGYQYQVYDVKEATKTSLVLVLNSADGDNNFPGNVEATVTYTLTEDNAVEISYDATTDKTTVINMTNHSYFNLNGDYETPITNHMLQIAADYYTPVDSTYMTTGEIAPVAGTLFDFTSPKAVGQDITEYNLQNDEQLHNGNGYDHNWVLNTKGDETQPCVHVFSPETRIALDVYTNEPGIQVYSGNFLDGTQIGKGGKVINQRCGLCLETQKYPDSPNKIGTPGWEISNAYVKAGEKYHSYCKFAFSIEK